MGIILPTPNLMIRTCGAYLKCLEGIRAGIAVTSHAGMRNVIHKYQRTARLIMASIWKNVCDIIIFAATKYFYSPCTGFVFHRNKVNISCIDFRVQFFFAVDIPSYLGPSLWLKYNDANTPQIIVLLFINKSRSHEATSYNMEVNYMFLL